MKKKQVLSVALFFAVCYISLCIYVYQRLDDSFTQMNEGEFDMEVRVLFLVVMDSFISKFRCIDRNRIWKVTWKFSIIYIM